jgi:hypothetical protein
MVDFTSKKKSVLIIAGTVFVGAFAALTGISGAQSDDGEQVDAETSCGPNISVTGGHLVSWDTTNTVAVSIPVGDYVVTGISSDPTHGPGVAPEQVAERWAFSTNTGLTSGVTPDIPENDLSISAGLGSFNVTTPISSVTFTHHGDGNSTNSVYPSLVFACVEPEPAPATATPTTAPPTTELVAAPAPRTPAPTTAVPTTAVPVTATPTTAATEVCLILPRRSCWY